MPEGPEIERLRDDLLSRAQVATWRSLLQSRDAMIVSL